MISTVTATTTAVSTPQIMAYSIIAVLALIVVLATKEILSSGTNDKRIKSFIKGSNVAIIPLLLIFVFVVGSKVVSII
jgi:hypothetical protein